MIAHSPIVVEGATRDFKTLEREGPFDSAFRTNDSKAYEIMAEIMCGTEVCVYFCMYGNSVNIFKSGHKLY